MLQVVENGFELSSSPPAAAAASTAAASVTKPYMGLASTRYNYSAALVIYTLQDGGCASNFGVSLRPSGWSACWKHVLASWHGAFKNRMYTNYTL